MRLSVGDSSIVRDFVDVRDVAKAYFSLLREGESGDVYNVCRGIGHSIDEIIATLGRITGKSYDVLVDPGKLRPSDNRKIVGDHSKLTRRTGWEPSIGIEESLTAVVEYFKERVCP